MTNRTTTTIEFSSCKRHKVQANFQGGEITSDAGVLLLQEADRRINLTKRIADKIDDCRQPGKVSHTLLSILRQRVYAIAMGYEDLNDHDTLCRDIAFQTAVGRDSTLASRSTLQRFEKRSDPEMCREISKSLVEVFIESFNTPPKELILDFDCTDIPVHGHQMGRFYHGYYGNYCFLPLYIFCGNHLLGAYLKTSGGDPARGAWGALKLLAARFRKAWPKVRIVFRADSGFCRHQMFNWCEKNQIDYIVGIARNPRLEELATPLMKKAQNKVKNTGEKQRLFGNIQYAAETWKKRRRIIVKAEHTLRGRNPRFIVTNMAGATSYLYDKVYCARGEAENKIKEQQLDLFGDRTSCMNWLPNQLRVLLSGLAYTLMEAIRRLSLKNTSLSNACCGTIRLKMFKIGAVIIKNTRRIRLFMSSAYPYQKIFSQSVGRLRGG